MEIKSWLITLKLCIARYVTFWWMAMSKSKIMQFVVEKIGWTDHHSRCCFCTVVKFALSSRNMMRMQMQREGSSSAHVHTPSIPLFLANSWQDSYRNHQICESTHGWKIFLVLNHDASAFSPRIVWHAIYESLCCWLTKLSPLSNP